METPLFEDLVSRDHCPSLLFKHATKSWPAATWTPETLASALQDKQLQCKVAPRDVETVQWETESLHVAVSLQQYVDWLMGRPDPDNPLVNFDPAQFSCYIDYKYMKDMFAGMPSFLKAVDWGVFGLKERDGEDSTIWIGSAGAYTPCHYDTYGFNLVAQLYGSKRWYLFSPDQTSHLYATRLPYEESSVFSQVNIRWPDLGTHPLLKGVAVYIVDLEPGDVLYVPQHWWHFVECLESSISVNTWIPMKEDAVSQYHEAISRLLFTSMFTRLPGDTDVGDYINTNEELQPLSVNLAYVNKSLKHVEAQSEETTSTISGKLNLPRNKSSDQRICNTDSSVQLKHDAEMDNFEQFAAAFPGICVRCTASNNEKCDNSSSKRKLEDDTKLDGNKLRKIQKSNDEGTEIGNTCTESLCRTCVGKDALEISSRDTPVEILQCRKYSFDQYLSFLRENNEYDYDEVDTYQVESPSEKVVTNKQVEPNREAALLQGETKREVTLQDVINSVLQPEVVQKIAQVLQKRVCT